MSTPLKCNIKDCPTNNLTHRAKRLVKVASIAKVCKTKKHSNNCGAKNKFYSGVKSRWLCSKFPMVVVKNYEK